MRRRVIPSASLGAGHMAKRTPEEKALRDSWQTPDWVLNYAEGLLGSPFRVDLAASPGNAVAPSMDTSAWPLGMRKACLQGGAAWLNPPFSDLGAHVRYALSDYQDGYIGKLGVLTLGDISTSYWAQLQASGAIQVPIIGRWSCDPPPGLVASQSKVPFALWVLSPELTAADTPEPAHWRDIQAAFPTKRQRY